MLIYTSVSRKYYITSDMEEEDCYEEGIQIVIGAAVALALVGGGLAGRAMYVEHQRNQAAAEHAKQEKLMNDKVTSHADKPMEINGYWYGAVR